MKIRVPDKAAGKQHPINIPWHFTEARREKSWIRAASQIMSSSSQNNPPSGSAQGGQRPLLVYMTAPEKDSALELARQIVENRLAAGANVAGPVQSFYRWQGKVRHAEEWQIFIQTEAATFSALENWVLAHHPHQVPCIIATAITVGHEPFLNWINANSSGSQSCK